MSSSMCAVADADRACSADAASPASADAAALLTASGKAVSDIIENGAAAADTAPAL